MFGLKFRRQHPVGNYILDFYCAELKLCIEVDGGVHELFATAMHDVERSGELSKLGIHVVRVRNEDVFRQPTATWDFLVGAVVRVLCERTGRSEMEVLRELHTQGSPLSPPQWGEGEGEGPCTAARNDPSP
jgi:very-short-patch-repair endonuclease